MPLLELYTDLVWKKKVRGTEDSWQIMKSVREMIEVEGAGKKRLNFLVQGRKYCNNLMETAENIELKMLKLVLVQSWSEYFWQMVIL